ncbi:MAG: glycosyltransferase family 4 protein [Rhodobacteraceae bacterium]|nr:glycosyltransferase family 4 protein [Paracoccaceae bacterium]
MTIQRLETGIPAAIGTRPGGGGASVATAFTGTIRALFPVPCVGAGVAATCRSILTASAGHFPLELFTARVDRAEALPFACRHALGPAMRTLPYVATSWLGQPRLVESYLSAIAPGDLAYLWPSTPLAVYRELARRGILIAVESLNTRMEVAKPVLDAAYDRLGLPPDHGITPARIAEQNERHALASAIFSPSPATDAAFAGTALAGRAVPASYGTWIPNSLGPRAPRAPGQPVTFLFLGTACIRKGIHHLLAAWRDVPATAHLRIVGRVEPAVARLFADVLAQENVTCAGFSRNVSAELASADVLVLPSLEEGDPIATYEAAAHGLAVIASPAGAGRIGAETGAIDIVAPHDRDQLRDMIARFAGSEELRRHRGQSARAAALLYDWSLAGPQRFSRLSEALSSR